MIRNFFSILVIFTSMATTVMALQRHKEDPYKREWEQIDSLVDRGLPKSAAKICRQILASAQQKNDGASKIKAQLFLMGVDDSIHENADIRNIQRIDSIITSSQGPEKAIWQSINADLYWQYLQRNRWQLYNRTPIAGQPPADMATWDIATFIAKASELYQASILDSEPLKTIPVERYTPILLEGKNTRHLRPTLYDFLAFRAIAFFENDEKDVIKPAYQFQVDGTLWFEPAKKFSAVKVKPADPEALHFKALHTYQQVLAFHLNDEKPDALIDADLQRLSFVHRYSVHPDRDSLYLDALQKLTQHYTNEPAAAQAHYELLRFRYEQQLDNEAERLDLPSLKNQLDALIDRFPLTEGAANAMQLRHTLLGKSLTLQSEAVVLPQTNSKALLGYRNLNRVFFALYPISSGEYQQNIGNTITRQSKVLEKKPIRQWEITLQGADDHRQHYTEVAIDPLPVGSYILVVASSSPAINSDNMLLHAVPFQVSTLSILTQKTQETNWLVALHRQSGMPIRGAQAIFWESQWDNKTNEYKFIKRGQSQTDEDGKAAISFPNNQNKAISRITLIQRGDTLQTESYHYNSQRDEPKQIQGHTFFFTDRAIYRPGQTVYFKGIMVTQGLKQRTNTVLANEKSKVTLYDVNGQVVTMLDILTNEYGSFSGKFVAPASGLTGQMRIGNETGQTFFSVEEYKRPKFQVTFDVIRSAVSLNEEVAMTGQAVGYAGNAIDGANVAYRVVRRARFPFYWTFFRWGQPQSAEMEITNGTTQTRTDGSFEVKFTTIPDRQLNPNSLPVFTYTVYADVTDVSGETQSNSIGINAGYRSLQIQASLPGQLDGGTIQTLTVATQNLDGTPIANKDVIISVAPLRFPGKLYRQRLWEKPDRPLLSEADFRRSFPDDEYENEADYRNWPEEAAIWTTNFNTGQENTVALPHQLWRGEGWHLIELRTNDAQGQEVIEKKYTYVSLPASTAKPQVALSVMPKQLSLQPGDTLNMRVKTGFENTYVLENNTSVGDEFITFSASKSTERPITETDRGGVAFHWVYVYNNRVYDASQRIDVPWSNRDLQLEWATHRDKLLPGEAEEWQLTIKGERKETIAAELLAGLYDASLDALRPHNWYWDRLSPLNYISTYWNTQPSFGINHGNVWGKGLNDQWPPSYEKRYDLLFGYGPTMQQFNRGIRIRGMAEKSAPAIATDAVLESAAVVGFDKDEQETAGAPAPPVSEQAQSGSESGVTLETTEVIPVRTNLQETAFFLPQLRTDAEGNVTFKFNMPEALTEWRMMAFAHTRDWKTGYLEGKVKTQKDLMVMPNLPRFLRQGDRISISTKISNLAEQALQGVARLEILDATTLTPISDAFGNGELEVGFNAEAGQSTAVSWPIQIPHGHFEPVVIRISAKAGDFTDGEESTLPVITNRMLVTETLPLPIRGNERKTFTLPKLLNSTSNTLANHALTVEFTGNPAWYAVQALPYLMEYPYECAEQVFNRFYATALAGHIVAQSPKVAAIFDQWRESDTTALLSNLEKNQELKSALLEETPWVMEAKNESEQKRRIALLFDSHKLAQGLQQNLAKLAEMQLDEGGFPWFKGMQNNRYITQYIITGIARLQRLGVAAANNDVAKRIVDNALPYLDRQIKSDYSELVNIKADLEKQHISYLHIQYLYMRSFFDGKPLDKDNLVAFDYYRTQAVNYWPKFNPYLQGQTALVLHRMDDARTPAAILASLRETAIHSEEMGMYWKSMPRGYWWYEAPIEAQALLVEVFAEVADDAKSVDDLNVWLLKQKQTQHWSTTKATADATYALLLRGSDWLANEPAVTITLGSEIIRSTDLKTEAGTGYFKKRFDSSAITPTMGNIAVQVDNVVNEGVAWGALYWQYFEDLDKISSAETPLGLRKQLYIERNTDRGPVLTEITEGNTLKVGDKVKIRIELRVDRDMEYVHLKDMRAACFEPTNVLSGYRYQGGLGYYESTRDMATNFFFDYLRKGTYVFEYSVFVSQIGDFSNGIATIQSMYAPEFSSHSEGIRVNVD